MTPIMYAALLAVVLVFTLFSAEKALAARLITSGGDGLPQVNCGDAPLSNRSVLLHANVAYPDGRSMQQHMPVSTSALHAGLPKTKQNICLQRTRILMCQLIQPLHAAN